VAVCPFNHGPGKEFLAPTENTMLKHLKEEHMCFMWHQKGIYSAVDMKDESKKRQIYCKQYVPDKFPKTTGVSTVIAGYGLNAIKLQPLSGEHYGYHAIAICYHI